MLPGSNCVVLGHEPSLRSRVLLWFYPNRGWKGGSHGAETAAGAERPTEPRARAVHSSSPLRKATTHAV
jgi:hypothetical protein